MMTTRTLKVAAVAFALVSGVALAKTKAQCQRDVKEFIKLCEKSCDQQLAKKNPKAADGCKKNCESQSAQLEKGCDK